MGSVGNEFLSSSDESSSGSAGGLGFFGAGGGIMTHEVVEAECRDGWDAYCKTDCAGSVGTTYQTLDPAVLVGG